VEQQRRVGWSGTRRSSVKVLKGMVRRRHPGDERERERAVSEAMVVEQNG
jgi:hypothetical protein